MGRTNSGMFSKRFSASGVQEIAAVSCATDASASGVFISLAMLAKGQLVVFLLDESFPEIDLPSIFTPSEPTTSVSKGLVIMAISC